MQELINCSHMVLKEGVTRSVQILTCCNHTHLSICSLVHKLSMPLTLTHRLDQARLTRRAPLLLLNVSIKYYEILCSTCNELNSADWKMIGCPHETCARWKLLRFWLYTESKPILSMRIYASLNRARHFRFVSGYHGSSLLGFVLRRFYCRHPAHHIIT